MKLSTLLLIWTIVNTGIVMIGGILALVPGVNLAAVPFFGIGFILANLAMMIWFGITVIKKNQEPGGIFGGYMPKGGLSGMTGGMGMGTENSDKTGTENNNDKDYDDTDPNEELDAN